MTSAALIKQMEQAGWVLRGLYMTWHCVLEENEGDAGSKTT
jgi:hypothetical protein